MLNVPSEVVETHLGTFNDWRGAGDTFPPRREVGRFLAASWAALAAHVPLSCSLSFVDTRVSEVAPAGEGVEVEGTLYGEALLTTGHAHDWPGALTRGGVEGVGKVLSAFAPGDLDAVTEADTPIVRGVALTFVGFEDVHEALVELSGEVLAASGASPDEAGVRAVLDGKDGADPVEDLRASLGVALGERAWTPAAAVGYAFRAAYDAVIERSSFGGRDSIGGERFGRLTRTLERVAFGPPAETAGEVLALIDSGRIRTDLLGRGDEDLAQLAREVGASAVIPAWARRVTRAALADPERVHGLPPLRPREVSWWREMLGDGQECGRLVETFGSPVNVVNPAPMRDNIDELVRAGAAAGVETKVFFARKANKALVFADEAREMGHGVHVASENELREVLERGMPGERIICSAAIKPDRLLALAIDNAVVISADSRAEAESIARLAPDPRTMPPTRFGERLDAWAEYFRMPRRNLGVVGIHAHLHGYAAADRASALRECMRLVDALAASGHAPAFVDIGGGVPMSYPADEAQWRAYQDAIALQGSGYAEPFTWRSDPLRNTYPYWQEPTRGAWLTEVLSGGVAEALRERGLRLHLEPGRSLADGCGLTLAEVAFTKTRSDGVPLVGLAMNRTQCRTTSDDFLIDPYLVKRTPPSEEIEAFLVGAYCIEDELILRRKIRFPRGVAAGDLVAIPNTAGYFMHILESASHQIPLAKNVVWPAGRLDDIDVR